jgi:hypothetical protein
MSWRMTIYLLHGLSSRVCGDTCPTFGDDTTTTNGFSIAPSIDEDGKLQTRFRLPNSTSTEPMFYTVELNPTRCVWKSPWTLWRTRRYVQTVDLMDCWSRDLRVLYRYYDDIFIRSMSLQTDGSISLRTFKYWVGECDIPYQSVLIDDVTRSRSGCSRWRNNRRSGRRLRLWLRIRFWSTRRDLSTTIPLRYSKNG